MRRAVPVARLAGLTGDGLTTAEAAARRQLYGGNDIVEAPRRRLRDLLKDTAADPMIWFLAGASSLYAALGDRAEAVTLLAALVPLVAMDAFLHRRTQASTEGLSSRLATTATVRRDGRAATLPAAEVVPGDLAEVPAGTPFPADGLVVDGSALLADESALTGEAYPVPKSPAAPPSAPGEPPMDAAHWGFAGTRLLTGRAVLRVLYTGAETRYGEIVRSAAAGSRARTPLQREVARLVAILLAVASALCVVLAVVRYRQGHGLLDAALSAVTLAVAALPEELPVAFTFFLGVGVFRLARRHALVRRAVSVENVGRVTCICSDKTGTITEGRLSVTGWLPAAGAGEARLIAAAAAASRRETGDPLDAAILDAAAAKGATRPHEVLATFPFTEDRRRETAAVRGEDGGVWVATKGSPEVVLPLAAPPGGAAEWADRVAALAAGGRKVIACAWRTLEREEWTGAEPAGGYTLAGLVVCADAVRPGVADAVARCRDGGIRTIMVTGDHPATALAVAREIGLGGEAPRVIAGDDLEAAGALDGGVDVVARAMPSQKLALVRALRAAGEIVAVTGDGVNDVPALQAADVGIAMGERGTRSAREAAAIVLLDDDFGTIVGAVAEGRQLFANLKQSYHYLLVFHIALVLPATVLPLAGLPLLYLPVHIVWLETIVHPTAMLVFQELPASGRLRPQPARRRARFFTAREWIVLGATGLLLAALIVVGYARSMDGGGVAHARSMAIAALSIASAALAAWSSRLATWSSRVITGLTVAGSAALLQAPGLARLVHVTPLHRDDWALALAGTLAAVGLPLAADRLLPGRAPGPD